MTELQPSFMFSFVGHLVYAVAAGGARVSSEGASRSLAQPYHEHKCLFRTLQFADTPLTRARDAPWMLALRRDLQLR